MPSAIDADYVETQTRTECPSNEFVAETRVCCSPTEWSAWSSCDLDAATGNYTQSRDRTECPSGNTAAETRICCTPTAWTPWGPCSADNSQTRTQVVCPSGDTDGQEQLCSAPGQGCVQSWGSWKKAKRREEYGCDPILLCGLDDDLIFKTPPKKGNRWLLSAHQYLAARYSETCGCSLPNATDVALIAGAGLRLVEVCASHSGAGIPYVGRKDGNVRIALTEDASALERYNTGNASVLYCECSDGAGGQMQEVLMGSSDSEVLHDHQLIDLLVASESIELSATDFMYAEDEETGLLTVDLNGVGIACIVIGIVAAVAVIAGATILVVRRRRQGRARFTRVGSGKSKVDSSLLQDVDMDEDPARAVELSEWTSEDVYKDTD